MCVALFRAEPPVDCFLLKLWQELYCLASAGLKLMFSAVIFGGIDVVVSGDLVGVYNPQETQWRTIGQLYKL